MGIALAAALLLMPVTAPPALAAPQGSARTLPTDHPATILIERLRLRGWLDDLSPLARPYRRGAVAAAVARAERPAASAPADAPEREWLDRLRAALAPDTARAGARRGLEATAGLRASSTPRLDPARPFGDPEDLDAWPHGTLGAWIESGAVAGLVRVRSDAWFPDDPDGADLGRRLEARVEEAYVSADLSAGGLAARLFLGRTGRSWGPAGPGALGVGAAGPGAWGRGLLISDLPASYPHLALELAAGPVAYRTLLGELDSVADARRWLTAQQIEWRVGPDLWIAGAAAVVWAGRALGAGPRMLAPLGPLWWVDSNNEPDDALSNALFALQAWWRRPGFVLSGEAVLDDFTYEDPLGRDEGAPPRYALRAGLALPRLLPRATVRADYEQVSSYAYRAQIGIENHLYLGRGLGANFADHDRLELRIEWYAPVAGLTLAPMVGVLRQGEGDPRTPLRVEGPNPDSVFLASPALFLGTRTDTYRVALAGSWMPGPLAVPGARDAFAFVGWDLGVHRVTNEGHREGENAVRFMGIIEAGLRVEF